MRAIHVLLVEPDDRRAARLAALLPGPRFQVSRVAGAAQALAWLERGVADLALFDPGAGLAPAGADLQRLGDLAQALPSIGVLDHFQAETMQALAEHGAQDTLLLPEAEPVRVEALVECVLTRARLARLDSLTGLPNRALLYDRLSQAIRHAGRYGGLLAVMFFDLDRFKFVNDTLGHAAGDALLKTVAVRLRDSLRQSDTVARLGGDEFIAVATDLPDPLAAARIARNVVRQLSEPVRLAGDEFSISPSIGIAVCPTDGEDADELIRAADAAMYQAKQQGGARYMFYRPDMNAESVRRMGLAFALQRALRRQEFELHYQPQLDLAAGRVVGLEALVRWRHPERGLVAPDQFIPLAEELGLMIPLGDWVLRHACGQLRRWSEAGFTDLRIAVNLSARQFGHESFLEHVLTPLTQSGLGTDRLELELTESSVMQDPELTRRLLERLSEAGVRIAIDDFGTGYSSLAYLRRFPLDALKIDRSFVRDIIDDANDAAIVRTVIGLARNLNLEVVAEGVETEAQLRFLKANGCGLVQGYLLGRPVPAAEVPGLLARIDAGAPRFAGVVAG